MEKITAAFMTVITFFASLLGLYYGDSFTPGEFTTISPEQKAEDCVRIMSFNVRCTDVGGVPMIKRKSLVVDEVKAVMPDSMGVQEATVRWMKTLRSELTDYASVGGGRDGGDSGEHSAIFYLKNKYELVDSDTFWLSETPEKPSQDWGSACKRICTWARLKNKETGEEYVHVNTHLDHVSEKARVNGVKMIVELINTKFSGMKVVFTADMNSHESEEPYKVLTGVLSDARFSAERSEPYGTFHSTHPETRENNYLDYVMHSDNVNAKVYKTVTSGIDNRFVSDHFPIYADVCFR